MTKPADLLTSEALNAHLATVESAVGPGISGLIREALRAGWERCTAVALALGYSGPFEGLPAAAEKVAAERDSLKDRVADLEQRVARLHHQAKQFAEDNAHLRDQLGLLPARAE